jgi:hypothetical protein
LRPRPSASVSRVVYGRIRGIAEANDLDDAVRRELDFAGRAHGFDLRWRVRCAAFTRAHTGPYPAPGEPTVLVIQEQDLLRHAGAHQPAACIRPGDCRVLDGQHGRPCRDLKAAVLQFADESIHVGSGSRGGHRFHCVHLISHCCPPVVCGLPSAVLSPAPKREVSKPP